ncbi:MAG: hypothetical protein ACI87W_000597 [Halieaceae bacterium]|jgi:hypothetical protein
MFNSLRATITAITVFAMCAVCFSVVYFSIDEYQRLYAEASAQNLDALSENLARAPTT